LPVIRVVAKYKHCSRWPSMMEDKTLDVVLLHTWK